jgi:hypothetical protein
MMQRDHFNCPAAAILVSGASVTRRLTSGWTATMSNGEVARSTQSTSGRRVEQAASIIEVNAAAAAERPAPTDHTLAPLYTCEEKRYRDNIAQRARMWAVHHASGKTVLPGP